MWVNGDWWLRSCEEPTESTAVAQNNNIPNEGQEPDNTASAEDEVVNVWDCPE